MRHLILTTVCVFTLNLLNAQLNDLALLDSNTIENNIRSFKENDSKVSKKIPNANYLEKKTFNEVSSIVLQWKLKIANYDLKNESVFDNSEKATYRIVFKNKQVKIVAIYNNSGEVLSTVETYRNVKIPYELRAQISKEHPGCIFIANTYYTDYSKENGVNRQYYKVQISHGSLKKTLKFNKDFKSV